MAVARAAEAAASMAKEEAERAKKALLVSRGEADMWSRRAKTAETEASDVRPITSEITVTPCSGHCFSMVIFLLIRFM